MMPTHPLDQPLGTVHELLAHLLNDRKQLLLDVERHSACLRNMTSEFLDLTRSYALQIRDVAARIKGPHGKTLRTIADQLERETLEDPPF